MNEEETGESWVISDGESEDGIANSFRLRMDLPGETEKKRLNILIIITWNYEPEDASRMPGEKELERMELFEDLMDEGVVEKGFGRLVSVFTGDGVREWQFYSENEEVFMQRLNETLAGEDYFPIEIDVFEDENWEAYGDYRKLLPE